MIDTNSEDYSTICPYCGHEQENEGESLTFDISDDNGSWVSCDECDKEYIQYCTDVTFYRESFKKENWLKTEIGNEKNKIEQFRKLNVPEDQLAGRKAEIKRMEKLLKDLNNE